MKGKAGVRGGGWELTLNYTLKCTLSMAKSIDKNVLLYYTNLHNFSYVHCKTQTGKF